MADAPVIFARPAIAFAFLGAFSGLVSYAAGFAPFIGFIAGPGLVYGMLVLLPWAYCQQLHGAVPISVIITSSAGYALAFLLTTEHVILPEQVPEQVLWPLACGLGLSIALTPLIVASGRRAIWPIVAAVVTGAIASNLFPWALSGSGLGRTVFAFVAWQSTTAFALGMAALPPSPNPLLCTNCQYNLHGNTTGQCPECGHTISAEQQRHIQATAPADPT